MKSLNGKNHSDREIIVISQGGNQYVGYDYRFVSCAGDTVCAERTSGYVFGCRKS
ncbi:hypothetical protein SE2072C2_48210 (plasmid) [Salmonella enterica]|nr:hypothetical protein SE2072C2_48210 [Salmonella enterica]